MYITNNTFQLNLIIGTYDEDIGTYDEEDSMNAVKGKKKKRLMSRGVISKDGKWYQSILCSIRAKYFIFFAC